MPGLLAGLPGDVPVLLQPQPLVRSHHQPGEVCRADCHTVCHAGGIPFCQIPQVSRSHRRDIIAYQDYYIVLVTENGNKINSFLCIIKPFRY